MLQIFIGHDPREKLAFDVCAWSILRHASVPVKINAIRMDTCRNKGLFWRNQEYKDGRLWDEISDAPCATEFSLTRFLTPHVSSEDWALFMDCDMLLRSDINELMRYTDPKYAVICTKHRHLPQEAFKMDNQIQTTYSRKNWSSFMMFNCNHPSNKNLTIEMINELPGRELHNFCWLNDRDIGSIPITWNHLVGYNPPKEVKEYQHLGKPHNIHFTEGMPFMYGYEHCEYADIWRNERDIMEIGGVSLEIS